ncbi:MAG TPA: O-antigen ligase family protein [Lacipirellula sp.]
MDLRVFEMQWAWTNSLNASHAPWRVRCAAAAAIGVGFWFVGHSLDYSRRMLLESSISAERVENQFAAQQAETTTSSAVGYFLLGGLGAACFLSAIAGRRGDRMRATRGSSSNGRRIPASRCGTSQQWRPSRVNWLHPLGLFCVAYVGWCAATMLWSIEPPQTFRKLAILGLMLAGAVGLASRFDLEDLIAITVVVLAGFVGVGLLAEVAHGTFRPWRNDYRFSGTCHPNDQGLQCALLALAAWFMAWEGRDRPWLRRLLIAGALAGLALSKSRTTLLALVIAAAVALVLRSRGLQRWLLLSGGAAALSVVGILMSFASVAALDQTADVAAMGRRQNINSLTGRLPLWHELSKAAEEAPLVGHGYGAFWGEKNVLRYSEIFSWHIPHGHNAYLDLVLATGFVGAALYVAWVLAAAAAAAVRHERTGQAGYLFVASLIVMSLVHGVTESKFPGAGMGGFLLLVAIAAVTLHQCATGASPVGTAKRVHASALARRQRHTRRWHARPRRPMALRAGRSP